MIGGRKKRNFVGSKMHSTLHVNGTHTYTFKLDTGAEAKILPFDLYNQVCSSLLRPTSTVLCGFGNAVIKPLGFIDVAVYDREGREFVLLFYVTDIIDPGYSISFSKSPDTKVNNSLSPIPLNLL